MVKAGGTSTFLIVMVLAMVVYSIQPLRDGIGAAMDVILAPLPIILGSWLLVILVLAAITGSYSSLLQKYTIDYEKIQRVQKKMKEFQKVYREAQLAGDEKKLKKMKERQEKMMQEQLEMSQEQFKPMAWIMLITVPIFLWMLYRINTMGVDAQIVFPYWGPLALADPTPFFLPAWILWYMLCSLTLTQVIRKTLNIGGL